MPSAAIPDGETPGGQQAAAIRRRVPGFWLAVAGLAAVGAAAYGIDVLTSVGKLPRGVVVAGTEPRRWTAPGRGVDAAPHRTRRTRGATDTDTRG